MEKTNRTLLKRHLEKEHGKTTEFAERKVADRYGYLLEDDPV